MSNSKATQLLILTFIIITIGADTIAQNIYSQYTWEERDKWQQVPKILETMGVSEGDAIADIGCHEGYMTFKFVDRVGESGKVYAVDVNKSRLNALNDLLEEEDIENVVTIKGDYDNPNLEPESLDFAFIMDAYHEMEDYQDILRHIKSALKANGKLVILEPIADAHRTFSRERQMEKHDISMHYVVNDLKRAGYDVILQKDKFINRAPKKKDQLWIIMAKAAKEL